MRDVEKGDKYMIGSSDRCFSVQLGNSRTLVFRSCLAHIKAKLAILAAALLFAGCMSVVAVQNAYADEATTIDGVTYTYNSFESDNIRITGMTSSKSVVKVPNQINGKPVAAIAVAEKDLGNIKAIDASNNPSLQGLWCHHDGLTSLNVSGDTALKYLRCENNNLTALDLSGLSSLGNLYCYDNALTSLNLTGCTALSWLECGNNNLTSLSLDGLTSLDVLFCENNSIKDTSALEAWAKDRPQSQVLPQKASEGKWIHGSKGWWYKYSDGAYAKGFQTIKGATYYFDANGWMKTGWQKINNNYWYYFKSSGVMATGWVKVKNKWYFMNNEGIMRTGKITDQGKIYFLDGNGVMKTGWVQQGSNWYYTNKSGAMTTGWQKVKGAWYYLNPADGKMKTGKQVISGKTYFLKSSGAMKTGWNQEGLKWYYYDKSGAMKTNAWISGKYWVGTNGIMATSSWVDNNKYYVDANGKWVPDKSK